MRTVIRHKWTKEDFEEFERRTGCGMPEDHERSGVVVRIALPAPVADSGPVVAPVPDGRNPAAEGEAQA